MERKALAALGLLALVAFAGCSATGSLSMKTADNAEIAEVASRPAVVDSPAPDDRGGGPGGDRGRLGDSHGH